MRDDVGDDDEAVYVEMADGEFEVSWGEAGTSKFRL